MEGGLVTLSAMFRQHLPYYMAIGMSPDEYWDGDCLLVRYYHKAHQVKQELLNEEYWLQGAYTYEALLRVAPVLHPFSDNPKPIPYLEKPFALTEEQAKEQKAEQEKRQMQETKQRLKDWATEVNKKWQKT